MSEIINSLFSPSNANLRNAKQNQTAGTGDFDALLSSVESKPDVNASHTASYLSIAYAGDLLGSLTGANEVSSEDLLPNLFPFSADFDAAFGAKGPLIDFINRITSSLNLTSEQNQALQNIAIKHKDITYSSANVEQIGLELQQAGIV